MKSFIPVRRTELYFALVGLLLMVISIALLFGNVSFVRVALEAEIDPFATTYAAANVPPPTPLPQATPAPTEAQPYATPVLDANGIPITVKNMQKAYLIFPAARALLTKTGDRKRGYPVKFKFEVDPKETPCTFTLMYDGGVVIEKQLKGSLSGAYTVPILVRKPGLYTWQIKTRDFTSEVRELTVAGETKP